MLVTRRWAVWSATVLLIVAGVSQAQGPGFPGGMPGGAPRPSGPTYSRPGGSSPYGPSRPSPTRPSPYRPSQPYNPQPHNPQRPVPGVPTPGYRAPGSPSSPTAPNAGRFNRQAGAATPYRFGGPTAPQVYVGAPMPTTGGWHRSQELILDGHFDQARASIDQQIGQDRSLSGMMGVVSAMQQAHAPSAMVKSYRTQALEMARAQVGQNRTDPMPWVAIAKFSLEDQNDRGFREATTALVNQFPNDKHTPYFNGIRALRDEDWKTAEQELRRARKMGVPEESIAVWLKMAIDRQKFIWEYAWYTLWALLAWAAGLLLLFVLGKILSAATLRATRRADPTRISTGERALRRIYRWLIGAAGIYYYVSLPLVVLLAVALPLSIGYALLVLRDVSLPLIVLVVVLGAGGVWTALTGIRACFLRVRDEDPGQAVGPEQAPALWSFAREVAEKVGTRPVDEIWLVPGAQLAVLERGSLWRRQRDRGRRALVLGVAALDGLRLDSLRSMLAHEYGHFLHRDTAGGDVALRVNLGMARFAESVVRGGRTRWWDVGFQFLRAYHFLFRRISFGASRLQEVLADRVAVFAYGPTAFREGMQLIVRRSVEFGQTLGIAVDQTLRTSRAPASFYRTSAHVELEEREEMERLITELLESPSTQDDTHPSPRERFAIIDRLGAAEPRPDDTPAWDLFPDRAAVLDQMDKLLSEQLADEVRFNREANKALLAALNAALRSQLHPVVLERRALIHWSEGRHDKALADLDRALQTAPEYFSAMIGRALINKRLDRFDKAAKDLATVVRECPEARDWHLYCELGTCHARLGRHAEAAEAFTRALRLNGHSLMALLGRANALLQSGDSEQAMEDFDRAAKRYPHCPDAFLQRGRAHQAAGTWDLALADYRAALTLDPRSPEARICLADLLVTCPDPQRRDATAAVEVLQLLLEAATDDPRVGHILSAAQSAQAEQIEPNTAEA